MKFENDQAGELHMEKPQICELEEKWIVGRKYPTALENERYFAEIPGFYHDFGNQAYYLLIPDKAAPDMAYGVSCDFSENGEFAFLVGEEVNSPAQPPDDRLVQHRIPAGKYAIFKANGTAEHVQLVRKYIYGVWLPNSQYELASGPDYEMTDVRNSRYPDDMRMSVYIPLL